MYSGYWYIGTVTEYLRQKHYRQQNSQKRKMENFIWNTLFNLAFACHFPWVSLPSPQKIPCLFCCLHAVIFTKHGMINLFMTPGVKSFSRVISDKVFLNSQNMLLWKVFLKICLFLGVSLLWFFVPWSSGSSRKNHKKRGERRGLIFWSSIFRRRWHFFLSWEVFII